MQGEQVEAEPDQNHLEDADSTVGMIDKNEIDKEWKIYDEMKKDL